QAARLEQGAVGAPDGEVDGVRSFRRAGEVQPGEQPVPRRRFGGTHPLGRPLRETLPPWARSVRRPLRSLPERVLLPRPVREGTPLLARRSLVERPLV